MKARILLIADAHNNGWAGVVRKAVASFANLEINTEQEAIRRALWLDYDLVMIDAGHVDDASQLIVEIHRFAHELKLVVAMGAPRWRTARIFFQAGAADCLPKSQGESELRASLKELLTKIDSPNQHFGNPEEQVEMKEKILLADNDTDFLITRKELLERAGYLVVETNSLAQARATLEAQSFDAAILDNRLLDNDNPEDRSGLDLAQRIEGSIPVILMTDYPDFKDVRGLLRNGRANISYLSKTEGPGAMLSELERLMKRRVFIVHGRDETLREKVARFIERLQLQAVILDEQPAAGLTIIEKFERYSNVGFVVVLLTPDDAGCLRDRPQDLKPRARQNVIFELGYFSGKLGRRKVCALYEGEVEIPSDYQGVEYLSAQTDGAWKLALARAMKQAGLDVDLNRVA